MTDSVSIQNIQKNLLSETVFGRYRVSTPYSLFEFNSNQDILLSDLFNYFTSDVALVTVKSIASSGSLYYNMSWKEFLR